MRVSWHAETHAHTLTVVEHWRSKPVVAVRILHFSKVLISAKPAASASSRLFFFYFSFSFVHLSASYVFFFFYGISFISPTYLCRFDSRTLRSTGQTRPPPPPLASPVHYAAAAVAASSLLSSPLFTNARARAHALLQALEGGRWRHEQQTQCRNENNRTWTRCVMTSAAAQVSRQERWLLDELWIQNLGPKVH